MVLTCRSSFLHLVLGWLHLQKIAVVSGVHGENCIKLFRPNFKKLRLLLIDLNVFFVFKSFYKLRKCYFLKRSVVVSVVLFFLHALSVHVNGQVLCLDAYSCYGDVIPASSGITNCIGAFACANATLVNNGNYIRRAASHACYDMNILQYNGSSSSRGIECRGLRSCAYNDVVVTTGYIQCYSEQACSNSIINFTQPSGYLDCNGDRSCSNIILNGNSYQDNEFDANLAASNSTLYSGENATDVNYYFYGGYSGYNTTIICQQGSQCNIYCSGTGCNQATVYCDGSCNVTIDCNIGNDVYGSAYYSLYSVNIANVTGSVIAFGSYSMTYSNISNATNGCLNLRWILNFFKSHVSIKR